MKQLSSEQILKLARSASVEEFAVNKDLMGYVGKKFCQKHGIEILCTMAAQHHDINLARALLESGHYFEMGEVLYMYFFNKMFGFDGQPYIKVNMVHLWYDVIKHCYWQWKARKVNRKSRS